MVYSFHRFSLRISQIQIFLVQSWHSTYFQYFPKLEINITSTPHPKYYASSQILLCKRSMTMINKSLFSVISFLSWSSIWAQSLAKLVFLQLDGLQTYINLSTRNLLLRLLPWNIDTCISVFSHNWRWHSWKFIYMECPA